jgi:hypothetical protein
VYGRCGVWKGVVRNLISSMKMPGISGALLFSGISADAAQLYVGSRTCSDQLDRCITYRRIYGPFGSGSLCVRVFHACMRSGVWDATAMFPYGGTRLTGMVRR